MFIVVYEFTIKPGEADRFREAWSEVTRGILQHRGSFGSRLHATSDPLRMIGYAQWPSREQWASPSKVEDEGFQASLARMRSCLERVEVTHELDVIDDQLVLPR